MPEPVYDDDKDKDLKSLTPEAIRNLEDKYSTSKDEAEDQAIEQGADPESQENQGAGRNLRQRSEAEDKEKEAALNQQLKETWQNAREHDNQVGRGYSRKGQADKNLGQKIKDNRKRLILGGGIASILIALTIGLFGFLNVFKLDDIMTNIDQKVFSRFNSATSLRSDKWVQSYFFLRLTQLKGASNADPDSEYFRAQKVDTNSPIRDWYRTMRASQFETDLAKSGVVFANRDAGNGVKFSVLLVDGSQVAGLTPGDVRSGKLVDELRTNRTFVEGLLSEIDLTKPGGNAEARQKIKTVVNELSQDQNVLKRRQVRKAIQNMTGVRDWRFFETTQDKISSTKTDIRNKILTAAIPEDTKTGKFIRCFFGITSCRFSEDPVDPENDDAAVLANDDPNHITESSPVETTDPKTGKTVTTKTPVIDYTNSAAVLRDILSKVGGAVDGLNLISTMDLLAHVDHAIQNNDLSKGVAVARGIQAMGLYQVFETARDQLKTGQVTSSEVNQFMEVIGPVASSEGWVKVINGQGNPGQLTNNAASQAYCAPKHQAELDNNPGEADSEFTYLCPDKQIGGSSNAAALENAYNNGVGKVISPIVAAYEHVRNLPIIGQVISLGEKIIGSISSEVASVLIKTLGIGGDLQSAIQYMVTQLASFLGAGPISPNSAGDFMNWLVQGGAYTAEASARTNGASLTSSTSRAAAQSTLATYTTDQAAGQSFFTRYLSSSNPNSITANGTLALSQIKLSSLGNLFNLSSFFKSVANAFEMPFKGSAIAATNDGYAGADFAGIQTFDYPAQCYNRDPITETPQDGTNIQAVLGASKVPSSDLTWDLVDNSTAWYQYVYQKIGNTDNADKIAEQIYNCNLLDNAVRGGLGYIYGYSNDNGLN